MQKRIILSLALLLAILLCGCAGETPAGEPAANSPAAQAAEPEPTPTPEPTPSPSPAPVVFAAGAAPWDSRELELALEEGETALLDELPLLERLDARESACFEEIWLWSQSHPEVEVLYTVPLPGLGKIESGTEQLDMTQLSAGEILEGTPLLGYLPKLRELSLPAGEEGLSLEQAMDIARALPETVVAYPFTIYGEETDLSATELVLYHIRIDDEGEQVRQVLPCMHACTWLDMDSCHVSNEAMARIRDENPDVEVIWRVYFGENYSARTNVTKILASMPSQGGRIDDSNSEGLNYCTKVRYLDLGHNSTLSDFSFVENMPDLEIAVISMAAIEDLTPFASCQKLLYLEMGNTQVSDLSPLAQC